MRATSDRYRARVAGTPRWVTEVSWSNDGWATSSTATYVSGTVTASLLLQTHWTCSLTLAEVPVGEGGINGFSTQVRVKHGMAGEQLFPMGVFKVNTAKADDDDDRVEVAGSSYEWYIQNARFPFSRTFRAQGAQALCRTLLQEVIPGVPLAWETDDITLPQLTEERDRWGLIDGRQDATSIARALGAYVFAGPSGGFVARDVPTLYDDPVWTADRGGVLLSCADSFTDEGVYNMVVYKGEPSDDQAPLVSGVAQDLDPSSLTYVKRPITQGGFGVRPRFYTSQLVTTGLQAQKAAQAALAPLLGLRTQVDFSQLHDPSLEPGDVGLVRGKRGVRRVLLDEITYDLTGAPMTCQTRTTATTIVGDAYVPPADDTGE